MHAFWGAVQKASPHMLSLGGGSVDEMLDARLRAAAEHAIHDFMEKHDRDRWTKRGTVVTLSVSREYGEQKLLGFVWESDFDTFRMWATVRLDDWTQRKYRDKTAAPVDAGLVRLEFDKGQTNGWMLMDGPNRVPTKVLAPDNAWHVSFSANYREGFVEVREMIEIVDVPLMRIPVPRENTSSDRTSAMVAVERLVAEINMARFGKTNWEASA